MAGLFWPFIANADLHCDFRALRKKRPVTAQANFRPVGDLAPKYQPTLQKAYTEYQQKVAGDAALKELTAKLAVEKDPIVIESLRTRIEKAEQTIFKNALAHYLKEDELMALKLKAQGTIDPGAGLEIGPEDVIFHQVSERIGQDLQPTTIHIITALHFQENEDRTFLWSLLKYHEDHVPYFADSKNTP